MAVRPGIRNVANGEPNKRRVVCVEKRKKKKNTVHATAAFR